MQEKLNDKARLLHYDSCEYTHSSTYSTVRRKRRGIKPLEIKYNSPDALKQALKKCSYSYHYQCEKDQWHKILLSTISNEDIFEVLQNTIFKDEDIEFDTKLKQQFIINIIKTGKIDLFASILQHSRLFNFSIDEMLNKATKSPVVEALVQIAKSASDDPMTTINMFVKNHPLLQREDIKTLLNWHDKYDNEEEKYQQLFRLAVLTGDRLLLALLLIVQRLIQK